MSRCRIALNWFFVLSLIAGSVCRIRAQHSHTGIEPPAGQINLFFVTAKGEQAYVSQATVGDLKRFEWVLLKPAKVDLFDASGARIGRHSKEAFLELSGSQVTARTLQFSPAPEPGAPPWMLLEVVKYQGPLDGMLSTTAYIQRRDTIGGAAPTEAPVRAGIRWTMPYTAKYVFWGRSDPEVLMRMRQAFLQEAIAAIKSGNEVRRASVVPGLLSLESRAQKAIPALIEWLTDERAGGQRGVYMEASPILASIGADAVPPLIDVIKSNKGLGRIRAIEAIGIMYDRKIVASKEAVPDILDAALGSDERAAFDAWQVLGRFGRDARIVYPILIARFKDPSLPVDGRIATILWNVVEGPQEMLDVVLQMLASKDARLHERAFQTLCDAHWSNLKLRKQAVMSALIAALNDSNPSIRFKALGASSLSSAGTDAAPAIPALISALNDSDETTALWAAAMLGQIGPVAREAIPSLNRRLESSYAPLRLKVAFTLSQFGSDGKQAVPVFMEQLKLTDSSQVVEALRALERIGPEARKAIPLIKGLTPRSQWAKLAIASALKAIER